MENRYLKKLFLLDGFGAIVSAILLGVVLVKLEVYFGIPKSALYFLAALPCFFAIYDFYCYFKIERNLFKFLRAIAIVNLLYCCLSLGLAFCHREHLTRLGWLYIIVEIVIVVIIASIELKAASQHNR